MLQAMSWVPSTGGRGYPSWASHAVLKRNGSTVFATDLEVLPSGWVRFTTPTYHFVINDDTRTAHKVIDGAREHHLSRYEAPHITELPKADAS
ncbi:MAG: hypothetical protein ACJ762_18685 [Solirubrobacteraceae bacterium]